jgi:hypothetical protein
VNLIVYIEEEEEEEDLKERLFEWRPIEREREVRNFRFYIYI